MTALPSFDPRLVPVVGIDSHLPRVPVQSMQPAALAQRFVNAKPWVPEMHAEPRFSEREPVHASVLVPLVVRDDKLQVLLTLRTANLSTHSGQIAFPGGKADADDTSAIATALREAKEEIGLDAQFVEVLGQFPIYTTGSAFMITPVVGLVHAGFSVQPNPQEVADIFEVPLEFLMNPAHHRRHAVQWAGQHREWLSMPYTDTDARTERFIWGATAGILRNFYRFLLD